MPVSRMAIFMPLAAETRNAAVPHRRCADERHGQRRRRLHDPERVHPDHAGDLSERRDLPSRDVHGKAVVGALVFAQHAAAERFDLGAYPCLLPAQRFANLVAFVAGELSFGLSAPARR